MSAGKIRIVGVDGTHEVANVCSVLEALKEAGLSTELSVRVNGERAEADTPVAAGDTLAVSAPEVKQG